MLANGLDKCNCVKKDCARHGKCDECLEHHKIHKRYPPYCMRERKSKSKNNINGNSKDEA